MLSKRNSRIRTVASARRKTRRGPKVAGTDSACGFDDVAVRPKLDRTKALILAAIRVWEAKRMALGESF